MSSIKTTLIAQALHNIVTIGDNGYGGDMQTKLVHLGYVAHNAAGKLILTAMGTEYLQTYHPKHQVKTPTYPAKSTSKNQRTTKGR